MEQNIGKLVKILPGKAYLKAEMLCRGVQSSPVALASLGPSKLQSFIHGVVFQLDNGWIVNTRVWAPGTRVGALQPSDCPVLDREGDGRLSIGGTYDKINVDVLGLGELGLEPLQHVTLGDWFSLHSPTTLFCAPVRQCIYITAGRPCLFCTFEDGKVAPLEQSLFKESVARLLQEHPRVVSIALGGGTPQLSDMGASYYAALARIAAGFRLSVSVELVPPPELSVLAILKDSGVSSVIMSIETWNDADRARWCLGKISVSKEFYFRAWSEAIRIFGPGQVASVLLVGTENITDTYRGAEELIEMGVVPTLIPLRLYEDSRFISWEPVSVTRYLELESRIGELLRRARLSPSQQSGCTACGGCSLETALEDMIPSSSDLSSREPL